VGTPQTEDEAAYTERQFIDAPPAKRNSCVDRRQDDKRDRHDLQVSSLRDGQVLPGEVIPNSVRTPCRGERPSGGPDRQEEREEVTGGTHCAEKGPGWEGIARRSQKSASDRSASGRADHRGPAAAPTRQPDGLAASPPPYAGPSRGLTGPSVAGAKPVESERTGTLVGALVARRRSRVAIRPAPAGGE
jgi:hypothetical protein